MKRTFNLFILMTLIALAFSTLGVTSAQAGKSSAPSAAPITVLWSDNFESGYANWTMDGLWNAESDSDTCGSLIAPFPNPSNAAYYGQDGLCHYSTVDNNSGSLTMVNPVVLPGSGTLGMNFLNYQITEVSCGDFDLRLVDISTNGAGGPWTTLANLCTENTWHTASVDLSAYAGQSIHIRFRFDTVDSFANAYFGWMVDNVEIYIVGAPPIDTTPPVVTVPADITAEATSATGADVNFSASATDETSPANPTVSCNPASGSTFPIGTTQVDCQATDNANNTGHGYFNVTVQDKTPPVTYFDSTPPSLTNSTSATFTFHSTDAVSHPANIQHVCYVDSGPNWFNCSSPLNLNSLSEGYHVIWMYAADEAGNDNYATALIAYGWMVDLTAPSFGLVADNPYEATGPGGANAAYNASFSDDNGVASGSCTPASGSLFPIGSTQVNCTATDNAGNTANTSFNIIVQDTTAPTLNLPANITVPQTIPAGAVVNYTVSANDLVDASPTISCSLPSGMVYPLGTTTLNCSASDDNGNTSYGSFDITVVASGVNLLKKSDFPKPSVIPVPWKPFAIKFPYTSALDCTIFLSAPCSVTLAGPNMGAGAEQKVLRSGQAGDTFSFGLFSRADNVPNGAGYRVELRFYNSAGRLISTTVANFNPGTHGFEVAYNLAAAPTNYSSIGFRFLYQGTSGRVWFDDAFLYSIP